MAIKTAHTMAGVGQVVNLTDEHSVIKTNKHDYALYAGEGGVLNFTGNSLTIETSTYQNGDVAGVRSTYSTNENRSVINLGQKGVTQDITISVVDKVVDGRIVMGLQASGDGNKEHLGGVLNVNTQNLTIKVRSDKDWVYGVMSSNATTAAEADHLATLIIDAENTYIDVASGTPGQASGLVAMSQGILEVKGNLYVKADDAISARGDAKVTVNESKTATVQLNGDISFDFDKESSGTKVDADVTVNLAGKDSYWNGSAIVTYSGKVPEGYEKVSGLELSLANGASWIPTVLDEYIADDEGLYRVSVNHLAFDNGVIELTEDLVNAGQTVKVGNLTGAGGTVRTFVKQNDDGSITTGHLAVTSLADNAAMSVVADNLTADDVRDAGKTLAGLAGVIETEQSNANILAVVEEGDILGELTQSFDAAGNAQSALQQKENTKLSSFASVNGVGLMQWRHEMNDLTKRMGELRDAPEGLGTWVRTYGSSQSYGALGAETKNTSVQVGADYDLGSGWKTGAAFSYTDSSTAMHNGTADGDMYGFAVYGTWLSESGQFVDLIAKYSRMSTDFVAGTMAGSYDNNGYSVSAEYGWRFGLAGTAFVEPQVELTYGQVTGDDFTAANGVAVYQEDTDSFIARAGVRAGLLWPENKGALYLRASVLHDFEGKSSFSASKDGLGTHMTEDMGGTWYEFGLGANFSLTEFTYTYLDLEKTTGGEVKEDWRWNIGLRHVW